VRQFLQSAYAHYLATSRESRRYVVQCLLLLRVLVFGYVKRVLGTFWPPLDSPWDNRSECHMDRKRIQCLSNASIAACTQSIFNRFPVIQPESLKFHLFSTFWAHFGLDPWVRPWDNRGKCYMDGKRIQCWSNTFVSINLQPFTSYSEILVGDCNFFLPHLHLTPPLGCSHWNSGKTFSSHKTRVMELPGSEDSLTIG